MIFGRLRGFFLFSNNEGQPTRKIHRSGSSFSYQSNRNHRNTLRQHRILFPSCFFFSGFEKVAATGRYRKRKGRGKSREEEIKRNFITALIKSIFNFVKNFFLLVPYGAGARKN